MSSRQSKVSKDEASIVYTEIVELNSFICYNPSSLSILTFPLNEDYEQSRDNGKYTLEVRFGFLQLYVRHN